MATSLTTSPSTREMRKRRNKPSLSPASQSKQVKLDVINEAIIEEDEAVARDSEADLKLFSETIERMKSISKEILDLKLQNKNSDMIKEKKISFGMLFLILKKLNRLDKFRCQKATDSIQEAMQKVDNIHLQLQNLHYEAVHIKKEITKCLEFKSLDEDVNLVAVDKFYNDAPETLAHSSKTKSDSHQLMLARLQWELHERKELAQKLAESQSKQQKVAVQCSKTESYLENLRPTLKSILKATEPLQDELGVPLLASESLIKVTKNLPQPLCVLYVQANAYMDALDKAIDVSVAGDFEEAILWKESTNEVDEDSESDQEESGKRKRRRTSNFNKMETRRKKILQKHPLHVKITITLPDKQSISLKFFYLVALHIATVEVTTSASNSKSSNILLPSSILDLLFQNDTGNDTPNPTNHYQLEKLSMNGFSDYVQEVGRPYLWAQHLCGLTFISTSDVPEPFGATKKAQHSISSSKMEITVKAIKSRFRNRLLLSQHLIALEKGTIPISKDSSDLFCTKTVTRLSTWSSLDWNTINTQASVVTLLEDGIIGEKDLTYSAVFERGSAKMTANIFISSDYPSKVPFFMLKVNWQGEHTSRTDTNIREMEKEVNVHWEELVIDGNRDQLLIHQLERLRMCFDIYLETAAYQSSGLSEGPCEFPMEKIFTQSLRGKDHSLPFKLLPSLGIFTHR